MFQSPLQQERRSENNSPSRSKSIATLRAENARERITSTTEVGFDNKKYLKKQKEKIMERLAQSDNKLYIEFGGKLLFDFHAARVLPGYDPNVKIQLLQELSKELDIILCVNANDIESRKVRADFGIPYHEDVLKNIDDLRNRDLLVTAVVITQYNNQPSAATFINRLKNLEIPVYTHKTIPGYPHDIDTIVSDQGYGSCSYIETKKKIVVVTAPGPGSGKLATCLSQLYHEYRRGVKAGYAKFETFPVWNLELDDPINVAYEAATLDLNDSNMIDTFHLDAYGIKSINYNRDVDAFPVLRTILERITNDQCPYKSPTDMGVNCIKDGITNEKICHFASKQEIIRRYFRARSDFVMGIIDESQVKHAEKIMEQVGVTINDRKVVPAAREAASNAPHRAGRGNHGIYCGAAIQLKTGEMVIGTNSSLFHSAAACIISASKILAHLPKDVDLLSASLLDAIREMKSSIYQSEEPSLDVTEMLIALASASTVAPMITRVFEMLPELYGCEMHLTHIPTSGDASGLRKLGIQFTFDPIPSSRNLLNS